MKEDYIIRKSVALDSGSREDQLIFLYFYTLVIYHVFTSRSNKCTSKVVTPDNKQTMAKNITSWSETAKELDKDDNFKLKLSSFYKTSATPGANKLNLSYFWS